VFPLISRGKNRLAGRGYGGCSCGQSGRRPLLLLTPVHWLLSLAAWRALYQLVFAPYAWEKTEHGLAKSSRLNARMTRSLLELERYLSALKENGDLPPLAEDAPKSAATRRPHSRVAA